MSEKATFSQGFHVQKLINDQNPTVDELQALIESGVIACYFEAKRLGKPTDSNAMRKAFGLEPFLAVYKVVVDYYNLSLAQMIEAGKYYWVNDDITAEHFPVKGESKQVEITLLHFDRYISSDEAVKEIDKMGYRPATLPELLALGASQPELQRQFPIVALGSVWQGRYGDRYVPYLWDDGSGRYLDLDWFDDGWNPGDRFAVVRK